MNRDEIYNEIDYWRNQIERAQYSIYEYEENIQALYDQLEQERQNGTN